MNELVRKCNITIMKLHNEGRINYPNFDQSVSKENDKSYDAPRYTFFQPNDTLLTGITDHRDFKAMAFALYRPTRQISNGNFFQTNLPEI